ncbi:MAG: MMPL family transporter [Spirochaetales bacterium]|nr:MMPL family transporter [Spirochaetales bacterium]
MFISIIIAITIFFSFFAFKVRVNPDFYTVLPASTQRVKTLFEETGIEDKLEMHMMLSVVADDALSLKKLALLHDTIEKIEAMDEIESSVNPFNFLTFANERGRFAVKLMTPNEHPPETEEELRIYKDSLLNEPLAQGVVVGKNGTALNVLLVVEPIDFPKPFMNRFKEIISPLEDEFEVYYTGDAPIGDAVADYIQKDLFYLAILSLIAILACFFGGFRSVRSIFIPVSTIIISIIWGLGFTSLIGFQLTLVSIILPTFLLAIGSSYALHLLNEYYRNIPSHETEEGKVDKIIDAVVHSTHTISLAGLTTIFGFAGLFFTSITSLKEFGISISFGIFACVLLSLFFLPALLIKMPYPKQHSTKIVQQGNLVQFIKWLAVFVTKKYKLLVLLFFATIGLFIVLYPRIGHNVDYTEYFPENDIVKESLKVIIENSGSGASQAINITLKAPAGEKNFFLEPENLKNLDLLEQELLTVKNVAGSTSFASILKNINGVMTGKSEIPEGRGLIRLLSRYFSLLGEHNLTYSANAEFITDDSSTATIFLKVYNMDTGRYIADKEIENLIMTIERVTSRFYGNDIETYTWGTVVLLYEGGQNIQSEQLRASLLSILFVLVLAWIVFRKFSHGILAIIPLFFAIFFNFILMVLFGIPLDITTILVSNVAIGVGVDDALHFLLQYRKQRKNKELPYEVAVQNTLKITGRPIILTTLTIVAGFLMLMLGSFKPVIYFGILVSISLTAAMIATILYIPAFIILYNRIASWVKLKTGR